MGAKESGKQRLVHHGPWQLLCRRLGTSLGDALVLVSALYLISAFANGPHLCLPQLPLFLSHLLRKEVYFKCCVIYGGKSLAPAIHLSSRGHTCRGAAIPGVTHIYFLPGANAPGNSRIIPKLQESLGETFLQRTAPHPSLSLPLNHLAASLPL